MAIRARVAGAVVTAIPARAAEAVVTAIRVRAPEAAAPVAMVAMVATECVSAATATDHARAGAVASGGARAVAVRTMVAASGRGRMTAASNNLPRRAAGV